jgi:hypothetical protein
MFDSGERVFVLSFNEYATVKYVRMMPPLFRVPEVYSVILESRMADLKYSGTIVQAKDVVKDKPKD